MGFFGLILDNIIDMKVVLANGSTANVSSTSHPDLYWGMRGAGHNFGIITELNYKIYDNPTPTWYYAEMVFEGYQLEILFDTMNQVAANGTQPKELGVHYAVFTVDPKYPDVSARFNKSMVKRSFK